ncbi:fused MFS/spermidine synthase [bacterium]|nr:fused MFS/spermidine synthase [bacterium]
MRKRLILAILVSGFSGIVAQILLLRELLVTFYGNELSIGIILANWLILEAFGCFFLGKGIEQFRRKTEAFVGLLLLFSFSFPLAIYLTRVLKELIGAVPGEGLGLWPILYSSFLILLPVSLPHGALFTFSCKIYDNLARRKDASSIGKVYIYETLGTIAGGIAFTYLLIPYFHSFQIAFAVASLNFILGMLLLGPFWRHRQIQIAKIMYIASAAFLVLYAYLMFSPEADRIHHLSIRQQWRGKEVVHYQNSIYGNIAVIQEHEQYTFFSNSIPIITTPVPDITFVEEFVHLPMLSHSDPQEVLVISGGAGGVINEILKYPVERVDYVELDPLLLRVVKKFPTPLTQVELTDPRVNIKYTDGRLFIKRTPHKYDLVLVGLSSPSDLQANRLFTMEFFSLVKKTLKEKGILVITSPGSLTYLSEELRNLNACIHRTLKAVYPYVRIIPGDFNLFLASTSKDISLISSTLLSQRLSERKLKVSLLTPAHIEYRLDQRWLGWFLTSLRGAGEKLNQDFLPLGVFYSLAYWNALFSPYMRGLFRWFGQVNFRLFVILLFVFTLAFLSVRFKMARFSNLSVPFAIAATGFAGMIFDLALIFTFQTLCGYVYHRIGLLVTAFMVGVAVGSLVMTSLLERIKRDFASFLKMEIAIILFSAALPMIFLLFHPYLDHPAAFFLLQIVFLFLSFLSGLLIGAQFPLANKIYLKTSPNLSGTAGLLYGADLFGGWIAGILGGVVLFPVLGLVRTCIIVVMLKVCSLILVAASSDHR